MYFWLRENLVLIGWRVFALFKRNHESDLPHQSPELIVKRLQISAVCYFER